MASSLGPRVSSTCLQRCSAASSRPARLLVKVCAAPVNAPAPSSSKQNQQHEETFQERVEHVRDILKKEHEHHGQGKVMWLHVEGRGRRMTAGHDVEHTPDLSGKEAVRSVDYSLFG